MSQSIGGFGLVVTVRASNTFPIGIIGTEFADDADPFDIPSLQIGETAVALNGELLFWPKANSIKITINAVPNSAFDISLAVLLEANRVGRGKLGANDIITMTRTLPDGSFMTLTEGRITDGMPGNSVASAGRMKSKPYVFAFENKTGL